MVMEPHYQLTTKDHGILQAMLERYKGPHSHFAQLLERKIRASAIYFSDDIPPGVVTLNTRLTYRVNGVLAGPHIIVDRKDDTLPDDALSLYTIRGLALLGLAERTKVSVPLGQNVVEELRIEDVLSQPEAEFRNRQSARGMVQGDSAGRTGNVISFPRGPAPALMAFSGSSSPDDDDPGPRAA